MSKRLKIAKKIARVAEDIENLETNPNGDNFGSIPDLQHGVDDCNSRISRHRQGIKEQEARRKAFFKRQEQAEKNIVEMKAKLAKFIKELEED